MKLNRLKRRFTKSVIYGEPYMLLIRGRNKLVMLKLLGIYFSEGMHLKCEAVSDLTLMCSKGGVC